MKTTMIARLLPALIASLYLGAPLGADPNPNHARGFDPAKIYEFGEIDNLNIFNGNLIITLPLGQAYPVGGGLSYSLSLIYNGNVWDFRTDGDVAEAIPNRFANAGLGWQVSLGELVAPFDPLSEALNEGEWIYNSPSGAKRFFKPWLHGEEKGTRFEGMGTKIHDDSGQLSTGVVGYTRDGSYLRLVRAEPLTGPYRGVYRIEFPDGTVHTFEQVPIGGVGNLEEYELSSPYRLTRIEDRFGNFVEVSYPPDGRRWVLTDGTGRSHTINFSDELFYEYRGSDESRFLVESIELAQFGQSAKQYRFIYGGYEMISESCDDGYGDTLDPEGNPYPRPAWAKFLRQLVLPDGSTFSMKYEENREIEYEGQKILTCSPTAGTLVELELPTKGKTEYGWTRRVFPNGEEPPSNPVQWHLQGGTRANFIHHAPAVRSRTLVHPDGRSESWAYRSMLRNIGSIDVGTTSDGAREMIVQVSNPLNEKTLHYFSVAKRFWPDDECFEGGDPFEYGLPLTRSKRSQPGLNPWAGYFLSSETYPVGCPTVGDDRILPQDVCYSGGSGPCRPLRQTFVRYELDSPAGDPIPESSPPQRNPRLQASRTVFLDDEPAGCRPGENCPWVESISDWFDGLGHYRRTVSRGSWSNQTRISETLFSAKRGVDSLQATYDPKSDSDPEKYMIGPDEPWILEVFDEKRQTMGPHSSKASFCFDRDTGALLRSRSFENGLSESTSDIVRLLDYHPSGDVRSEMFFGGDKTPLTGTENLCNLTLGVPDYRIDHDYASGSLRSSSYAGVSFRSLDLDIDPATGLVSGSRDTHGSHTRTAYQWDELGRVTRIAPPLDAPTTFSYHNATSGSGSGRARAVIEQQSGGDGTRRSLFFDAFGRLEEERLRIPGGENARVVTRDELGRTKRESIVTTAGRAAGAPATAYDYDRLGRPKRIIAPDGSTTTFDYLGARSVRRTVSVQTEAGEQSSETVEEYDPFGRLVRVRERSSPDASFVDTSYDYDEADRLIRVRTEAPDGNQQREFEYDGRGFLRREWHPEKGETIYSGYDSRGHASRVTEDAWPAPSGSQPRQLRFVWDPAERLTEIHDETSDVPLKSFAFDGDPGTRGKLARAVRVNPGGPGGHWTVTEVFDYDSEGRVSARRTITMTPGGETVLDTTQAIPYNPLGLLQSVHYPSWGGKAGGTVERSFSAGRLTGVAGFTVPGGITYHPGGVTRDILHANNVRDEQSIHPSHQMARPHEIRFSGLREREACEPAILSAPQSQTVEKGSTVTLSVVASDATSYQWHRRTSSGLEEITGATGSSLILDSLSSSITVAVEASNDCGTALSPDTTVTVVEPPPSSGTFSRRQFEWKADFTTELAVAWPQPTNEGSLLVAIAGIRNVRSFTEPIIPPAGWKLAALSEHPRDTDSVAVFYIDSAASRSGTEIFRLVENSLDEALAVVIAEYEISEGGDLILTGTAKGTVDPSEPFLVESGFTGILPQASHLAVTGITVPGVGDPVVYESPSHGFAKLIDVSYFYVDLDGTIRLTGALGIHEAEVPGSDTAGHTAIATGGLGSGTNDRRFAGAVATFSLASSSCSSPSIAVQPASQGSSGGSVMLFVQASGTGVLEYQWYSGSSGDVSSPIPGATEAAVTVSGEEDGSYWVRITNECGSVDSATAEISFGCTEPNIDLHPQSAVIEAGVPHTLTSQASGSAPLAYQWFVNWGAGVYDPIEGATRAELTIALELGASARYRVNVSNACGYAMSDDAVITVGEPCEPRITTQPQTQALLQWSSTTLSVEVAGDPPLNYQWYQGESGDLSLPVAGATESSVTVDVTEPTAYWVRIANACGTIDSETAWIKFQMRQRPVRRRGDITGDDKPDIIWRERPVGRIIVWEMDDTVPQEPLPLPDEPDTEWEQQGTGDFNGDGSDDFLWRHRGTGENRLWLMDGTTLVEVRPLDPMPLAWQVGGISDWDGDHTDDIIWRNYETGENLVWLMSDGARRRDVAVEPVSDTAWNLVGSADFDGNLEPDLVWRNHRTGENRVWLMERGELLEGTLISSLSMAAASSEPRMPGYTLPSEPDVAWTIAQIGDFNQNERPDIVWRNVVTGENRIWTMSGLEHRTTESLPEMPSPDWEVLGNGPPTPEGDVLRATSVSVIPVSAVYGETVTLSATLADELSQPVEGREVELSLEGAVVGTAVTDAQGRLTLNHDLTLASGTYPSAIYAVFAGDDWYAPSEGSADLEVTPAAASITWSTPEPIIYGTVLDATQLNATSELEGTFTYDPAAGALLAAGSHELSVTFEPADGVNYTPASASVTLEVQKAEPVIVWATPSPIVYGTSLDTEQLNAAADVEGTFTYDPAAGTLLNAGTYTLTVTFEPDDAANYTSAIASVILEVQKAEPVITWAAPSPIVYGTLLDTEQLNAAADVEGTFTYDPAAGTLLNAGTHTLTVTFEPEDAANYTSASASVVLEVEKAIPVLTWNAPAPIVYGIALDETQLNAAADVDGSFVYDPGAGVILDTGEHTLHVSFTPADTDNYEIVSAEVSLEVEKAPQVIEWADPAAITYGTALDETQLNATVTVVGPSAAGTLSYTPSAGSVLDAGDGQTLTVTAAETENYLEAVATVVIDVLPAPLTVTAEDETKVYGAPLPELTGTLSGVVNGDAISATFETAATESTPVGTYPIEPVLHDPDGRLVNYVVTSTPGTLTITPAPLTATVVSQTIQYSDPAEPLAVTWNGFVLGETSEVLDGELVFTTDWELGAGPGTYVVTVSGVSSQNYMITFIGGTIEVIPEDAWVTYSGATFASTQNANSGTAEVTLAATVRDATTVDAELDPWPGDVRNARVRFVDRDSGETLCEANVGLVAENDFGTGTATCQWKAELGKNEDSASWTVGMVVEGWYARDRREDDTVVTVSRPLDDMITGGGFLVLEEPAGLRAGDEGSRTNFGFNVKFNKSGQKLQGRINVILRRTEDDGVVHVYQLKGNVMSSMATDEDAGVAIFNGKASIQDITDPDDPVGVDGNATLQVEMTDRGEGGEEDSIAITLWDKDGGMWFSSRWDGTRTIEQELGGGNVVVR